MVLTILSLPTLQGCSKPVTICAEPAVGRVVVYTPQTYTPVSLTWTRREDGYVEGLTHSSLVESLNQNAKLFKNVDALQYTIETFNKMQIGDLNVSR